jgi:hypothetical protein
MQSSAFWSDLMKPESSFFRQPFRTAALAAALLMAASMTCAADGGRPASTVGQERQNCVDGNTSQDRATCLREAGAAKQESQRGNLRDTGDYSGNASKRCDTLPPDQKADCERRSMGEGSVSGSVGGGGVVRELVTPVPAAK